MNKAMVTVIAIAPLFVSSLIQTSLAMPGPKISVEPPYLQVSPGEEFTVNITIYPEGEEIFGAQYTLLFDNSLLKAISQNGGPFLGGTEINNTIDNLNGKVDYGEFRTGSGGVTSPGVLATITFNAIESGVGYLNLSNVILSDPLTNKIPGISLNNGTCDIVGAEQTPTPPPTSTPTPTQTPPPSGEGDDSNGEIYVTPTSTSTPIPTPTSTPTKTSGLIPTRTPTINPVPSLSPSSSPATAVSPTPTASMPLSGENENKRLPCFEATFAILTLFIISYLLLKRKRRLK